MAQKELATQSKNKKSIPSGPQLLHSPKKALHPSNLLYQPTYDASPTEQHSKDAHANNTSQVPQPDLLKPKLPKNKTALYIYTKQKK